MLSEDEFYQIAGSHLAERDLMFAPYTRMRISYTVDGDRASLVHAVHEDGTYEILGFGLRIKLLEDAYRVAMVHARRGATEGQVIDHFQGHLYTGMFD